MPFFTIVVLLPDYIRDDYASPVFVCTVQAPRAPEAAELAKRAAADHYSEAEGKEIDSDDFLPVAVFPGVHLAVPFED